MKLQDIANEHHDYAFGFLDEFAKRELRRRILKAVAIPGYQVPFASRELPIARGWGTGGLQVSLALAGPETQLKVIDQGSDDSVNAANLRRFISRMTGCESTTDTLEATIIQSRHRTPEEIMLENQVLVLQVPDPEPLRGVEYNISKARIMHADKDYGLMYLKLYEQLVLFGRFITGASYPVLVHNRYIMSSSPIPRWDSPKFHQSKHLSLLSAGREKRLYAVPPYTNVYPLEFDDVFFEVEDQSGRVCIRTDAIQKFMNELPKEDGSAEFEISDTGFAEKLIVQKEGDQVSIGETWFDESGNYVVEGYIKKQAEGVIS